MKRVDKELLDKISKKALESPRLRMHYNFHSDYNENIQRMLNALEPDTVLPIHRHIDPDKDEIFLVLRGRIMVLEFDDLGNILDYALLDPQKGTYAVEIKAGVWHTLFSLVPNTVIYEIKSGPYTPISKENIAQWVNWESTKDVEKWKAKILQSVNI